MKFIGMFLSLLLMTACTVPGSDPTMDLSKQQWREDIEYYAQQMPLRHLNAFHTLSEADFKKEIQQLLNAVDSLSGFEINAELIRITQRINDGHTGISRIKLSSASYPIQVKIYDQRYIIVGTDANNSSLLGKELTHIDTTPISQVANRLRPYVGGAENEWSFMHKLPIYLVMADLLSSQGITSNSSTATLTLIDETGNKTNQEIVALPDNQYEQIAWINAVKPKPAYLLPSESAAFPFLWYQPLPDKKSVYVRFDSYPSMSQMESFAEELAHYINDNKLSRLIIDFRGNGGGDYYVGIKLSQPLMLVPTLDWQNGVYVIAGRETFSAAMSNTAQYKQMLNAKVIGEPTGANPVGYQELGIFVLPNSQRRVYHSKRIFRFQDQQSEGIKPDIYIAPSWQHEKDGRDPVIEWILAQ